MSFTGPAVSRLIETREKHLPYDQKKIGKDRIQYYKDLTNGIAYYWLFKKLNTLEKISKVEEFPRNLFEDLSRSNGQTRQKLIMLLNSEHIMSKHLYNPDQTYHSYAMLSKLNQQVQNIKKTHSRALLGFSGSSYRPTRTENRTDYYYYKRQFI